MRRLDMESVDELRAEVERLTDMVRQLRAQDGARGLAVEVGMRGEDVAITVTDPTGDEPAVIEAIKEHLYRVWGRGVCSACGGQATA